MLIYPVEPDDTPDKVPRELLEFSGVPSNLISKIKSLKLKTNLKVKILEASKKQLILIVGQRDEEKDLLLGKICSAYLSNHKKAIFVNVHELFSLWAESHPSLLKSVAIIVKGADVLPMDKINLLKQLIFQLQNKKLYLDMIKDSFVYTAVIEVLNTNDYCILDREE